MEKCSFYLNDSQISNASNYTYLGSSISSNGSFRLSKQTSTEKTRRCIFKTKKYLDFYKLPITISNKLFDALVSPILLYIIPKFGAYMKRSILINGKPIVSKNYIPNLARGAEVILPTFSKDKSILLLNCPLDT